MTDLISKSRLKNELSKIPSEMGLIKKAQVIQAIDKQKTQDSKHTHADRIRNMSDEELAELITGSLNFDCADYCDSFTQGCAFNCNKKDREIALKWLQSEAE